MKVSLSKNVSIGELLTAGSILVSLITVSINWYQDREIEISNLADQKRKLTIDSYANVLYWKDLNLHYYDKMEVLIEEVAREFASSQDIRLARDYFWKNATQTKNEMDYEIIEKEFKTFHLVLLNNGLDSDSSFIRSVTAINVFLNLNHQDYLKEMQDVILSENVIHAKETAILGNKMRAVNSRFKSKTREIFKENSAVLENYVNKILSMSNEALYER